MKAAEELGLTLITVGHSSPQKKIIEVTSFNTYYSRTSLDMDQWNLVCHIGSSVGSATTVVSMNIRLQSVRVAVKHYAPTYACHTNRRAPRQNK